MTTRQHEFEPKVDIETPDSTWKKKCFVRLECFVTLSIALFGDTDRQQTSACIKKNQQSKVFDSTWRENNLIDAEHGSSNENREKH